MNGADELDVRDDERRVARDLQEVGRFVTWRSLDALMSFFFWGTRDVTRDLPKRQLVVAALCPESSAKLTSAADTWTLDAGAYLSTFTAASLITHILRLNDSPLAHRSQRWLEIQVFVYCYTLTVRS